MFVLVLIKSLCHYICNVIFSSAVIDCHLVRGDILVCEVVPNVNMLGLGMEAEILSKGSGTLIINKNVGWMMER
jgi:hypothetical protein